MRNDKLNLNFTLEILISTMHRTSLHFLKKMFPYEKIEHLNILIINQTKKGNECFSQHKNIRIINSYEIGLSKSRNLAIKNAIGDICLIADDDVAYMKNFQEIIYNAYYKNPLVNCLIFDAEIYNENINPKYLNQSKKIDNIKELQQVCSVKISFKSKFIKENNIFFNEYFGLNSSLKAGEEWVFLNDIMRVGNVYFEKRVILNHDSLTTGAKIDINTTVAIKAVQYSIIYNRLFYYYFIKFIIYLVYYKYTKVSKINTLFLAGIKAKKRYSNTLITNKSEWKN